MQMGKGVRIALAGLAILATGSLGAVERISCIEV